jgi:hypothetical protein
MKSEIDLLSEIKIASPCTASWDEMHGDDRVRFCHDCQLNVYNLSTMTRPRAEALIHEKEGRLCVRLYMRRDGTALTENCPVGFRAARRVLLTQLGAIATVFTVLFSSVPILSSERRNAIRNSWLGQIEPFRSLFEWLDPTPLPVMLGMVRMPIPPSAGPVPTKPANKGRQGNRKTGAHGTIGRS